MLRERSVRCSSALQGIEPAPGVGFSIELDTASGRADNSNNLEAVYPVTIRIDGEAGTKKTITGPGMHWIDGGFRRLDLVDGVQGSYYRCTVAETRADGIEVVRETPTYFADPVLLGAKGLGPTPVFMLAGKCDDAEPQRGRVQIWRMADEGVPYLGMDSIHTPTALRTDALGRLEVAPVSSAPVLLAELTGISSSVNAGTFADGVDVFLNGVNSWTDNPAAAAMDVSAYRSILFEVNGGITDLAVPADFSISPYISLIASPDGGGEPYEDLALTAGVTFQNVTDAAAMMIGPGMESAQTTKLVSRARVLRLVKAGWTNYNNVSGVSPIPNFCARLWGFK